MDLSSSPSFVARVGASVYAAGAAVGAVVLLMPHPDGVDERGFVAVGFVCAVVAALLYLAADRVPTWLHPLLCGLGTALVSLDIYFAHGTPGSAADDSELFYVWTALFAAYFFSRRGLVVQLGLIAAAYLVVLSQVADASAVPTRWAQTVGTLTVAAGLVQLLRARVTQLVSGLTDAARTDSLTGLLNRRGFEELMQVEVERSRRSGSPLSLLLGDVDKFKQVNDLLGHAGGDAALIRIAQLLEEGRRQGDSVARTGGEEFAIVLPDTDHHEAYALAERLRGVAEQEFAGRHVTLTLSFGVASFPDHAASSRALQLAADRALYAAKEMGRNLAVIFSNEVASIVSTEMRQLADRAEVHLATLLALAEALDLRDMGTSEHSHTVGGLCERVANELDLAPARADRLRIAGALHDIGKIGLPDSILRKAGGLTPAEWEKVRKHPEIGAGILANPSFEDIRSWVVAHHERPDGTGYPRGLVDAEIPLEAKILAVADAYEAMTADRPYRDAMSHEVARAELLGRAGTRFDPRVVSALLRVVERDDASARAVPAVSSDG